MCPCTETRFLRPKWRINTLLIFQTPAVLCLVSQDLHTYFPVLHEINSLSGLFRSLLCPVLYEWCQLNAIYLTCLLILHAVTNLFFDFFNPPTHCPSPSPQKHEHKNWCLCTSQLCLTVWNNRTNHLPTRSTPGRCKGLLHTAQTNNLFTQLDYKLHKCSTLSCTCVNCGFWRSDTTGGGGGALGWGGAAAPNSGIRFSKGASSCGLPSTCSSRLWRKRSSGCTSIGSGAPREWWTRRVICGNVWIESMFCESLKHLNTGSIRCAKSGPPGYM